MKRVLSPLVIRGVALPNRVVRTAHVTNFGEAGRITDRFIAYHRARAEGGVGLTILEGASAHASSFFHPNTLRLDHPHVEADYRRLMAALAHTPMRVIQQLWHGGYNAGPADGSPPWSASAIAGPLGVVPAIAMSQTQIDALIAAFATAARRAAEGGLHGIEVHGAHGYLFGQFMAAATNRRTDAYGGDLAGRSRLLVETLRAVRVATPAHVLVGVRLGPELTPGGVTIEETAEVLAGLEAEGLVDFVNLSVSNYNNVHMGVGAMTEPSGYELRWTGGLRDRARVPVIVTGRIRTLEEAEQVLADGQADLVGMTRAHIADPDIVRKTVAGLGDEVTACIACNQLCVGGMFGPTGVVGCTVNPRAGAEDDPALIVRPAAAPRRVAVIGGGPAGLKAAIAAAARGHRVTLHEARPHLGGAARLAGWGAPRMGAWRDLVVQLEAETYRQGVEVLLSTPVDPDDLGGLAADHVIVATGAEPDHSGFQLARPDLRVEGAGLGHVLTSEEVLTRRAPLGGRAVVLDDVGHQEGVSIAERLQELGCEVTYLTRHLSFAPLLAPALRSLPALERLRAAGVEIRLRTAVTHVASGRATVMDLASGEARDAEADWVVMIGYGTATGAAFGEAAQGRLLAIVGDALSPRFLPTALHEGHRAGLCA